MLEAQTRGRRFEETESSASKVWAKTMVVEWERLEIKDSIHKSTGVQHHACESCDVLITSNWKCNFLRRISLLWWLSWWPITVQLIWRCRRWSWPALMSTFGCTGSTIKSLWVVDMVQFCCPTYVFSRWEGRVVKRADVHHSKNVWARWGVCVNTWHPAVVASPTISTSESWQKVGVIGAWGSMMRLKGSWCDWIVLLLTYK